MQIPGILYNCWRIVRMDIWNRYIVCACAGCVYCTYKLIDLVKNIPPIIPDNQNWYCVQSSCGDVPQRTYWDVRSLFSVGCPAARGKPSTFTAQPLRGCLGGIKHLAALPASKDAVSPSTLILSYSYPKANKIDDIWGYTGKSTQFLLKQICIFSAE